MLFIYVHIVFPYVSFPVLHISTRQRVVRTGPAPGGRAVSNAEPRGGRGIRMDSWIILTGFQEGMNGITLWLCQNSYWTWPFIVDFPIKNGDFS
jgi:hypothetical protein